MKITKLVIKNYRGIEALETNLAAGGVVVKGRNGSGKTTTLNAIRAALAGQDVGPEAIRNGATKAEILVDVDDVTIRRAITAKGSTLTVRRDGMEAKSPVKFLADLLGDCALDPLALITAKKADRRATVLAALPVAVTEERLRGWAPGLPAGFSFDGHGLDVVGRAHAHFYEVRKGANATAKDATTEAERLDGLMRPILEALSTAEALAMVKAAEKALADEEADLRALRAAEERGKSAREKAAALTAEAEGIAKADVVALESSYREADSNRTAASLALETAERVEETAKRALQDGVETNRVKLSLVREASALIEGLGLPDVTPDVDGARSRLTEAQAAGMLAIERETAIKAADEAKRVRVLADAATAEAKRLDGIVRTLADDAPAALLAESKGIPGLTLLGDDVAWKGVALGSLCGMEQTRICVEIARRLNAKSKILVVDGLERLDPEQLDVFLAEATRDGYQLIASQVARGAVEIVAIEAGPEAVAAE